MVVARTRLAVAALLLLLSVSGSAWAQGPAADKIVAYRIHELPNDPNSAVVFTVTLTLHAAGSSGATIGWQIAAAEFRQPGAGEAPDTIWVDQSPYVDSVDGLWWVEHSDPSRPGLSEFREPPLLVGIAAAVDPADDNLNYTLHGLEFSPPPEGGPYEITAAFTYCFSKVAEPSPFLDGEDDPVDIPDEPEPPTTGG